MTTFRYARPRLAPRWLTEGDGGKVGFSLDAMADGFMERLRLGHLARFPQNGPNGETAPDDALLEQGRDRRVLRGLSESSVDYALRLLAWLDDRKSCGAPFALLKKLSETLGPLPSFRTVDDRGNWFSRSAAGVESYLLKQENWDWDGGTIGAKWSRFWVIIYPNGLWSVSDQEWDNAGNQAWGDAGRTWGTTATPEEVVTTRAVVEDWMPLHTRCVNIIVAFDAGSFDPASPEPDGLWEGWSKTIGGVQVPARLSTARYWDGVSR